MLIWILSVINSSTIRLLLLIDMLRGNSRFGERTQSRNPQQTMRISHFPTGLLVCGARPVFAQNNTHSEGRG